MPSRPEPNWTVEELTYDNLQADPGLDFLFLEGGTVDVSLIDFTSANEPIPIDETYWYFSARASYWFRWSDDDENFFDIDSEEDLNFILEQISLFSMRPPDSRFMPELDGITIIPTNPDDAASDFYIFGFFPTDDSSLLRSLGDEQIEITTWNPLTDETVLPQFFVDGADLAYGQSWDNLDQWTENILSEIQENSITFPEDTVSSTSVPEGSMGFGLLAIGVILFGGICQRKLAKMFGYSIV